MISQQHKRIFTINITVILIISSILNYFPGHAEAMNNDQRNETYQKALEKIDANRIETFTIEAPQLNGRQKNIIVFLPPNYSNITSNYPVIYIQGAQEVFNYQGFENEGWYLNESLYEFYTRDIDNQAIMVGIESDPIYFWDEFSPWINSDMYRWMDPYDANRVEGGDGDAYLEFLINTLKPIIDERYRTIQDRENTGIAGYDMGGLFSIYAGLVRPDVFSQVMAMSPAVWFAENGGCWLSNNHLLKLIESSSIPEEFSISIEVDEQKRTKESEIRPAIYDYQRNKISFPQSYLQGARALVEAFQSQGLLNAKINRGEINLDLWWDAQPEILTSEATDQFKTYLPQFLKEGLDSFEIYIPFENRSRKIWVYLPPDYFSDTKSYQVIYLFDAQHIFGSETGAHLSDTVDWQFDEKLDELFGKTGKGTIAVGIEFDATHPWDEYMPWPNNNMDNWLNNTSDYIVGNGIDFLNFLVDDLKPEVDARYRTLADREHTAIGGGSRSALFSLYAGFTRPDIFSKVMAMSPAVWLAEGGSRTPNQVYYPTWLITNQLVGWIGGNEVPKDVLIFLYTGEKETSGPGDPYPYVKDSSGIKLTMERAYLSGVYKIRTEILNDLGSSSTLKYIQNPNGTHYPYIWRYYIETVLDWFGYY